MDSWELYDLKKDPKEMHNLYNENGHQQIIHSLKDKLKALQVKYKDDVK